MFTAIGFIYISFNKVLPGDIGQVFDPKQPSQESVGGQINILPLPESESN